MSKLIRYTDRDKVPSYCLSKMAGSKLIMSAAETINHNPVASTLTDKTVSNFLRERSDRLLNIATRRAYQNNFQTRVKNIKRFARGVLKNEPKEISPYFKDLSIELKYDFIGALYWAPFKKYKSKRYLFINQNTLLKLIGKPPHPFPKEIVPTLSGDFKCPCCSNAKGNLTLTERPIKGSLSKIKYAFTCGKCGHNEKNNSFPANNCKCTHCVKKSLKALDEIKAGLKLIAEEIELASKEQYLQLKTTGGPKSKYDLSSHKLSPLHIEILKEIATQSEPCYGAAFSAALASLDPTGNKHLIENIDTALEDLINWGLIEFALLIPEPGDKKATLFSLLLQLLNLSRETVAMLNPIDISPCKQNHQYSESDNMFLKSVYRNNEAAAQEALLDLHCFPQPDDEIYAENSAEATMITDSLTSFVERHLLEKNTPDTRNIDQHYLLKISEDVYIKFSEFENTRYNAKTHFFLPAYLKTLVDKESIIEITGVFTPKEEKTVPPLPSIKSVFEIDLNVNEDKRQEPNTANNQNHPQKGSRIKVSPFKSNEEVLSIKQALTKNPRDLLLFTVGVNSPLHVIDLLKLKVGDLRYCRPGQIVSVNSNQKAHDTIVNDDVLHAFRLYMDKYPKVADDDFLFKSTRGDNPIELTSLHTLVNKWAELAGIKGDFGTVTLRKTFGYLLVKKDPNNLPLVSSLYFHKNVFETLDFLGLFSSETVNKPLMTLDAIGLLPSAFYSLFNTKPPR